MFIFAQRNNLLLAEASLLIFIWNIFYAFSDISEDQGSSERSSQFSLDVEDQNEKREGEKRAISNKRSLTLSTSHLS